MSTYVNYGNQVVPLPYAREPHLNTTCVHCSRGLEWHWEDDGEGKMYMHFDGAVEINGFMWCNEGCELLSRLDVRPYLKDEQLAKFTEAFEYVEDLVNRAFKGGRI